MKKNLSWLGGARTRKGELALAFETLCGLPDECGDALVIGVSVRTWPVSLCRVCRVCRAVVRSSRLGLLDPGG